MDLMSPTDAVFLVTESREHPSGPFEFEAIAVRIGEVEITLHSECGDDLAAGSTAAASLRGKRRSRGCGAGRRNYHRQMVGSRKIETTPS
jgi:hypothetical protein